MKLSALSVSRHLTDLVGRNVTVQIVTSAILAPVTRTACYTVQPGNGTTVVQIDFHLLASLAGIMIGYGNGEIDAQTRACQFDENLTDAARELMNVFSAVMVESGRAVFTGLFPRAVEYSARAEELLRGGNYPLKLQVTPSGGKAGYMLIASDV